MSSLALNLGLKKNFFAGSSNNEKINNLIESVDKIFSHNYPFNYQQIYTKCHEICQSRHGKDLYETLEVYIIHKINDIQIKLVNEKENKSIFMRKFVDFYNFYREKILVISDIFLYLEKNKDRMGEGMLSLKELYIKIFFDQIINSLKLKNEIINSLFRTLSDLRTNLSQDFETYEQFIKILVEIDEYFPIIKSEIYQKLFEETVKFYSLFKNTTDEKLACVEFLTIAQNYFNKEKRLLVFLEETEKSKVFEVIIENLLISKMEWLIFSPTGLRTLVRNEDYNNIKMYFNNFLLKEGSKNVFLNHFANLITGILKELDDYLEMNLRGKEKYFKKFISELFILKQKFSVLISNSFENDPKIEQIVKSNLEKFVNSKNELSESLLNILHEEIKLSIKLKNNNNLIEFSEKFLVVFKLLNEKDLLEIEYRKALCKRILRNSVFMRDTESIFIDIMKKDSGSHFVMKMETMKNDLELSEKLNKEFRIKNTDKSQKITLINNLVNPFNINIALNIPNKNQSINSLLNISKQRDIEFYVKVLTDSAWPVEKMLEDPKNQNSCNLPFVLDNYIQEFTNFYYNKFKNRTLTWIHELSWAKIQAKFNQRQYTLIVSNYQMSILILFNSSNFLTFKDLIAKLGCSNCSSLKRHLFALVYANILKISKKVKSEEIADEDIIYINKEFSHKEEKIVLNVKNNNLNMNFIKKDNEVSHFILDDRKHQIDALIMKTLKNNKRMNFDNLKNIVIKSTSNYFCPEVSLIKNRLDNLIEREYIQRDSSQHDVFIYSTS